MTHIEVFKKDVVGGGGGLVYPDFDNPWKGGIKFYQFSQGVSRLCR